MKIKAIIISLKGHYLTKKESALLSKHKPWGIILFKRNISTLEQVKF
jgi:Beta-glucosidase-related glycosidases